MKKTIRNSIIFTYLLTAISSFAWVGICGDTYENFKCINMGEITSSKACYQVYDCCGGTRSKKCNCNPEQIM